jgi:hypothetical protein
LHVPPNLLQFMQYLSHRCLRCKPREYRYILIGRSVGSCLLPGRDSNPATQVKSKSRRRTTTIDERKSIFFIPAERSQSSCVSAWSLLLKACP